MNSTTGHELSDNYAGRFISSPNHAIGEVRDRICSPDLLSTLAHRNFDSSLVGLIASENCPLEAADIKSSQILIAKRLNYFTDINRLLRNLHSKIEPECQVMAFVQTNEARKRKMFRNYPPVISQVMYVIHFLYYRAFPKLSKFSAAVYARICRGNYAAYSKAEIFGRFYCAGFTVQDHIEDDDILVFIARKAHDPVSPVNSSFWPLYKMPRVGKNLKLIHVFKFRTMHPYSEYLQAMVMQKNGLAAGGKLSNDFRITSWGRVLRKYWIDELPMVINVLRGELKLIGVRPLSEHYFNLYTDEVKDLRKLVKPGLFPPFYADLPKTIDDIIESEKRYLIRYLARPVRTDLSYFIKGISNILFRRIRSK